MPNLLIYIFIAAQIDAFIFLYKIKEAMVKHKDDQKVQEVMRLGDLANTAVIVAFVSMLGKVRSGGSRISAWFSEIWLR